MESLSDTDTKSDLTDLWTIQMLRSFIVFATVSFVICVVPLYLFAFQRDFVTRSFGMALAMGAAGTIAWAITCGIDRSPAWWRVVLAGFLAGIFAHPFLVTIVLVAGHGPLNPLAIIASSVNSLCFLGFVTFPAGFLAALLFRGLIGLGSQQPTSNTTGRACDS